MNISSAYAPAGAAGLPIATRKSAPRLAPQAPDRDEVKADVAKVLSSSSLAAPVKKKELARARVQQIIERLKVLKKLFAYDPKQMARALALETLAQIFKELKSAVKDYARAGGDELSLAGEAAGAATTPPAAAPTSGAAPGTPPADPVAAAPASDHALYDAVVGEVRKSVGEDGLQFLKEMRALTNDIAKLLETAHIQARAKKPEKDLTNAVEDADTALQDLRKEMADAEQDIHNAVPTAGMRLSIAA